MLNFFVSLENVGSGFDAFLVQKKIKQAGLSMCLTLSINFVLLALYLIWSKSEFRFRQL